jgi:hypothetical protein
MIVASICRSERPSGWGTRAACSMALTAFAVAAQASAQAPAQPPAPPFVGKPVVPARMPDGHPNWTGFWVTPGGMLERDFGPSGVTGRNAGANVRRAPTGDSNLKSPYKERFEATRAALDGGDAPDYGALCIPYGMPRMMGMIYGMEILQTPKTVAITSEFQGTTRRILMNVKAHPPEEELTNTYAGHSIGHWEGDTMVVDTVGIRDDVTIDGTRPHSPMLRIVERFTQTSPGVLSDDMTIEDPDALIMPMKQTRTYHYRPDLTLGEFVCDNNRNVDPTTGKSTFK